ncbi:hypothetical protein Cgig2_016762 [Carnegiea gigantea]|uniref:Uncharacterized protein n=1 Tax=Carnegiea gigantea TaxID=171969 RepID=A0A9Q1GJQ5_9CARY|nr:hypothetical protein Cgig2_016762 [Carnegiea gigantea]
MTAIIERHESKSLWGRFCNWITSTENGLYTERFSVLMISTLLTATSLFIRAFIAAPLVHIDGIREPVSRSLPYRNNIIAGGINPDPAAIGLHFYPIWKQHLLMRGYTIVVLMSKSFYTSYLCGLLYGPNFQYFNLHNCILGRIQHPYAPMSHARCHGRIRWLPI